MDPFCELCCQLFINFFILIYSKLIKSQLRLWGMKQKRNKPRYNAQFKTFNSQQSCIDVFSRVESLFLEKFFRYNLSDYFQDAFVNVEEDLFIRRIKNKQLKQLASETFLAKLPIRVHELEKRMNDFYNMEHSQLKHSFKHLFGNSQSVDGVDIQVGELVMMQVKMRAQIEKIQNLPTYFYKELELCQLQHVNLDEKQEEELIKHLKKYDKKVLNLFIIYFGDINFNIFNRHNYQPRTVQFFCNQLEVKIYVFYVSRLALIDKFKKINKIEHLEYVNDLLIQLYEFKRDKARNRRLKSRKINSQIVGQKKQKNALFHAYNIMRWVAIISVTGLALGALYYRFFF